MRCRIITLPLPFFFRRTVPALSLSFSLMFTLFLLSSPVSAQPAKGANKFLGNITQRGLIPSNFLTYWNHIAGENECKWMSVEGSRDKMNWAGADKIAAFAREHDIPWMFYSLLTSGSYPSWVGNISDSARLEEIGEWMDSAAARYPDATMIDVINEGHPNHTFPAKFRSALGGNGATGFDWVINAFRMARERWPNAILFFNDYNNLEFESEITWTLDMITACKNAGAPIDAIGCEATYAWKMPTDTIKKNIDRIAAAGLPVYISNYEIEEPDDARQDSIMREQFTMFWNHPKIIGITYWGYVADQTWRSNMELVSDNGAERPALTWLAEYVKNNPDPPNDFPDLLNIGTGVVIDRDATPRSIFMNPELSSDRTVPRLFDLCGRVMGSHRFSVDAHSGAASMRAPGTYILQRNNSCRSLVNRR
ncbi:MAG: endo-1,4-beta-xylanase [Chitinispirillaceae bacterium]|nr:endo-1,4-beta-xylanase [Chitinispirillaceae bacterium]